METLCTTWEINKLGQHLNDFAAATCQGLILLPPFTTPGLCEIKKRGKK